MLAALLLAAALLAPAAAAPDGACQEDGGAWVCAWEVDTREPAVAMQGPQPSATWEVPFFADTLATVTVALEGDDRGWNVALLRWPGGSREQPPEVVSVARHAATADGQLFHAETTAHVLRGEAGDAFDLVLSFSNYNVGGSEVYGTGPASLGTFRVTYTAESLPEGVPPSRPAATREDPHLADGAGDARAPHLDVLAGWLDDARLGDDLVEAYGAIAAPDLTNELTRWEMLFTVGATQYRLTWYHDADGLRCALRKDTLATTAVVAAPECSFDSANATFRASFPEATIGSPANGTPIQVTRLASSTFTAGLSPASEDVALEQRYAFALGGPEVWSELNPRLDPPPAEPTAWYADPLATENIPDTLSVLGALLAAITFIVGFVALRRSRRQTRALLARVDRLVELHEADAREALLQLGKLESEFAHLFRVGGIQETQYQLAQQRIVAAASRIALRRELGLDDGAPGTRTVPVQDASGLRPRP